MRLPSVLALAALGALLGMLASSRSSATVISVDSKADIFDAGDLVPSRDGQLPPEVLLSGGPGSWVEIASASGTLNAGPGWPDGGADGGTLGPNGEEGTNVFSADGISGVVHDRFLFLAGVFLDASSPSPGLEPARLDFRSPEGIGSSFTDLSPAIAQTFFIGDGLTGTGIGTTQRFHVPASATRLFLGFVDANVFGWPSGAAPGTFSDNTGVLSVDLNVVPEPSASVLFVTGLGVLVVRRHSSGRLGSSIR